MTRRLEYFVIGVIVGGFVGAIVTILLAPVSGAEVRRLLANRAVQMADAARVVADRAEATAEVLGERVDHYLGRDQEVAWRKVREIREGMDRYTEAQAL